MDERAVVLEMRNNDMEYSKEVKVFTSEYFAKHAREAIDEAMMTLCDYGFIENFNTDILSEDETREYLKSC